MAEASLTLRERTTVIAGPLTSVTQNIATTFTQNGSDVVFISPKTETHNRIAQHLNDQREVNEKYGRCKAIEINIDDPKLCKEAISRAAETFGSVDIYIDALNVPTPAPFRNEKATDTFEELFQKQLRSSFYLSHTVINFLKTRKRGRMIYLINDECNAGFALDSVHSLLRTGFVAFAKSLTKEMADISCTVNVISMGLTEEYLMNHFAESSSIKEALEKMKQLEPTARLLNPENLANLALYLCSNLGGGISGETLRLKI